MRTPLEDSLPIQWGIPTRKLDFSGPLIPRHHRQPLQSINQIGSPQVRVAIHRQADRRVPGERLGHLGALAIGDSSPIRYNSRVISLARR